MSQEIVKVIVNNKRTEKVVEWKFTDWSEFYCGVLAHHIGTAFMNEYEITFSGTIEQGDLLVKNLSEVIVDDLSWTTVYRDK